MPGENHSPDFLKDKLLEFRNSTDKDPIKETTSAEKHKRKIRPTHTSVTTFDFAGHSTDAHCEAMQTFLGKRRLSSVHDVFTSDYLTTEFKKSKTSEVLYANKIKIKVQLNRH